jgi:hypothetical protein
MTKPFMLSDKLRISRSMIAGLARSSAFPKSVSVTGIRSTTLSPICGLDPSPHLPDVSPQGGRIARIIGDEIGGRNISDDDPKQFVDIRS